MPTTVGGYWYGQLSAHPFCAFCKPAQQPISEVARHEAALGSLRNRVPKEMLAGTVVIPSGVASAQRKLVDAYVRTNKKNCTSARFRRRKAMDKHVLVSQLWRTLTRVQL